MMDTTKWKDLTPEYDAHFYSTLRTELQSRDTHRRVWWRRVFVLVLIAVALKMLVGGIALIEEWNSWRKQEAEMERWLEKLRRTEPETSEKTEGPGAIPLPEEAREAEPEIRPDSEPMEKPVEVERSFPSPPSAPTPPSAPSLSWQELYTLSPPSRSVSPKHELQQSPAVNQTPFPRFELDRARRQEPQSRGGDYQPLNQSSGFVGDPRCPGVVRAMPPGYVGWVRVYRASPGQCVWEKVR